MTTHHYDEPPLTESSIADPAQKQKGKLKTARIPIKLVSSGPMLKKPNWIRVKAPMAGSRFYDIKKILREKQLHTVCEEGSCPNIGECFSKGTATFMIMGDKCTRRCPFCDVGHGRPDPLDPIEPEKLADTVALLGLNYVVITSVDRDDLKDGGAEHFSHCIAAIRERTPQTKIEILVPDFRGRMDRALDALSVHTPDVFNHNIETVPRLYKQMRPGSDYEFSLVLLKKFKKRHPHVLTKSGMMVGLGETDEELYQVAADMRKYDIDMIVVGQYLQPSTYHTPVQRYMSPPEFEALKTRIYGLGFLQVACGPLVRSSYHADEQSQSLIPR